MGERTRRRRLVLSGLAILAAVALIATAVVRSGSSPFDRARSLVGDASAFDTGLEAGETLAKAAQHLERAVEECRREDRGTSCQALSSAFGYAQVLAAVVLRCTAPGRHQARTRMAAYLEQVAEVAPDARRVPDPPRLPSCVE